MAYSLKLGIIMITNHLKVNPIYYYIANCDLDQLRINQQQQYQRCLV